jgi:4-diphosphocytidyl-2-C-methyl-D-erythritol kinase
MLLFSSAKINLGLRVLSRREDGFHNIETVFLPIGWSDMVEVLPHPTALTLHCTGLHVDVPQEGNLCARAFRLMQRDFGLSGADIFLHKQIPFGAGLGGGSSNAASTLRAVSEVFKLALTQAQLATYAAQLGSDCAFFIYNTPMMATGRGELLEPISINLSGYSLVVVKPNNVAVSTAEAYAHIAPRNPDTDLRSIIALPVERWQGALVNDFEDGVFEKYPLLRDIKNRLYEYGASYAAMSGSGSAIFGIFKHLPQGIAHQFPHCVTYTQTF